MNRRQSWPVAALIVLALSVSGGYTYAAAQHRAWQERENTAVIELESAQTAPTSWTVTGQPRTQHYQQCLHAIADYNTAATHLQLPQLDPTQECTP